MVGIERAVIEDADILTHIQKRAFDDDNKRKPSGCSMEGPPGYDSVTWNAHWIEKTPYFTILFQDQVVGGIIVFPVGAAHYELGRIWVDPNFQGRGIGQQAVRLMLGAFAAAARWTVGTPGWALRNQHFYEKLGFVRVRETEVDPDLGWSGIEYQLRVLSSGPLAACRREQAAR